MELDCALLGSAQSDQRVFDNNQIMLLCQCSDFVQLGRSSAPMDYHNRFGLGRDGFFYRLGVDIAGEISMSANTGTAPS